MNENKVSRNELARRCGYVSGRGDAFAAYLKGECNPRKQVIDKLLEVTGLTYEEAFKRSENSDGE